MKQNKVVLLSEVTHVLKRSARYLGSIVESDIERYHLKDNKIAHGTLQYIPALLKLFREILDNSTDEYIRTNGKFANKIEITLDDKSYSVKDNGRGIPVVNAEAEGGVILDETMPEIAWANLRGGSNFEDEDDNTTAGQNGEGSTLVNMWSKEFIGETCDGKQKFKMVCKDNLSTKDIKITKSKQKYTKVTFKPDLERFGIESIDSIYSELLIFDLMILSITFPKIKFYFNGKHIKSNFNSLCELFDKQGEIFQYENLDLAIFPNTKSNYNFIQFINGLNVYNGGKPIEWIESNIVKTFKDKLPKKYNAISNGDIKNKLTIVSIFKNMVNPRFEDQIKSDCITTYTQFKDIVQDIDFKSIGDTIYKNKEIKENITDMFDMKAEYEARKALKGGKKKKEEELLSDKYFPATKKKKYLVISEGTSARASQMKALGNFEFGFVELTGVPANVLEMTMADFKKNKRGLPEIYEIIANEDYDYILLGSDADADGAHINGLLIAFIYKYFPEKLRDNKIGFLRMPLIVIRNSKEKLIETLYTVDEYHTWMENNNSKGLTFDYKKGYGSLNGPDEMVEFLEKDGIDKIIDIIEWEESDADLIQDWFNSNKEFVQKRKDRIKANDFNINSVV